MKSLEENINTIIAEGSKELQEIVQSQKKEIEELKKSKQEMEKVIRICEKAFKALELNKAQNAYKQVIDILNPSK